MWLKARREPSRAEWFLPPGALSTAPSDTQYKAPVGTGLWCHQTREQGRDCLSLPHRFSTVPPSPGTALGTKQLLKKRVMREHVLPFVRGDDWMEAPLVGNHSPAEHQRRADSQLWLQGATATLPTEPDPSTHARQPPSHRREETRHHSQEPQAHPVCSGTTAAWLRPEAAARRGLVGRPATGSASARCTALTKLPGPRTRTALPRSSPEAAARGPEAMAAAQPLPRARPVSCDQGLRGWRGTAASPEGPSAPRAGRGPAAAS